MDGTYVHVVGQRASVISLKAMRLSPQEIGRLQFLRWRVDTGRIKPPLPLVALRGIAEVEEGLSEMDWARLRFLAWRMERGAYPRDDERTR